MRRNRPFIDLAGKLFGNAGTLISLAKYFPDGVSALQIAQKWIAIEEPFTTGAGVKARLLLLCDLGDIFAKHTDSPDDDLLVAKARTLANNDQMADLVASVIARFRTENPAASPAGLAAYVERADIRDMLREAATENQFDFGTLMQIFDLISKLVALISTFAGKPSSPSAPAAPGETSPNDPFGF